MVKKKNKMRLKIFLIIGLICLFNSCRKLITWDEFGLQKTSYEGNELRIDGYYYQFDVNGKYEELCCFYNNGVLLHMGGRFSTTEEMEEYINRVFILDHRYANNKPSWGLFIINGQIIQIERYYPTDHLRKSAYIREGKILNDTTYHITVSYRSNGSERRVKDEIYHFKQFSPKPDSTNSFVK